MIACVGETEAERQQGETEAVLPTPGCRAAAARIAGDRLRARLGDRNRQDRDSRDRAESTRVDQVAARHARALRRLGQARQCRGHPRSARRRRRSRRRCVARPSILLEPVPDRSFSLERSSSSTAGASRQQGRETPSSSLPHRCSTRCGKGLPHSTQLAASGEAVGLPEGQMGNSEVGHLTIGSGRVLYQDLMRVNVAVRTGTIFANPADLGLLEGAGAGRSRPSARPRLVGRRPLPHRASARPARARSARVDGGAYVDPCVHGRSRRLPARRRRRSRAAPGGSRRDGDRALLRHGPRQSGRAHRAGSRRDPRRRGRAAHRSRRSGERELRARDDGRVRRADRAGRPAAPRSCDRHGDFLQLSP